MEEVSFVSGREGWQHVDRRAAVDEGSEVGKVTTDWGVVQSSHSQPGKVGTYLPMGWGSHCCRGLPFLVRACCFLHLTHLLGTFRVPGPVPWGDLGLSG